MNSIGDKGCRFKNCKLKIAILKQTSVCIIFVYEYGLQFIGLI